MSWYRTRRQPRRQSWRVVAVVVICLAAAPITATGASPDPATETEGLQQTPGPQLALQPCRFPQRFERCLSDCERQERNIERIEGCSIEVSRYRTSTCPERTVALVRQCLTECNANFCPQFNP